MDEAQGLLLGMIVETLSAIWWMRVFWMGV
jgi:hypothetical protein